MFATVLAHGSCLAGCRRGAFCQIVLKHLTGGSGSGSCLAFLVRKRGRGPDQKLTCFPGIPTPAPSPRLGEPHRIHFPKVWGRDRCGFSIWQVYSTSIAKGG